MTEGDLLAGYDPYPASIERARQQKALSGYDRNGDGRCDAPACRSVLALAREDSAGSTEAFEVVRSLGAIGIDVEVKFLKANVFFPRLTDEEAEVPLGVGYRWGSDYPNASGMLPTVFDSSNIPDGFNSSLLGATPAQLRHWGYEVTDVPSVDDRIDYCAATTGHGQTECWAELTST